MGLSEKKISRRVFGHRVQRGISLHAKLTAEVEEQCIAFVSPVIVATDHPTLFLRGRQQHSALVAVL
jgi:hypothetical protein